MFSLKNVEKPLVLLCFRSKMLKNQWFYKRRGRKTKKTIGFTVKPVPATSRQPRATDSDPEFEILAMLKNHWFYKQRGRKTKKNIGFTVKPVPATDSGSAFAILAEALKPQNHWFFSVPYGTED